VRRVGPVGVPVLAVVVAMFGLVAPAQAAAPANDTMAAPTFLELDSPLSQPTAEATTEVGELVPGCQPEFGHTVWFTYAPSADRTIAITTEGSDYDTVLAVYSGGVELACSDDVGPGDTTSRVQVDVVSGSTYLIQAGGFQQNAGQLSISSSQYVAPPAPANDNFAAAEILSVGDSALVDTTAATDEQAEPTDPQLCPIGSAVWYRYDANSTGALTVSAGGGTTFDTLLAAYEGESLESLQRTACNRWGEVFSASASRIRFGVKAGHSYYVQAGGNSGAVGSLVLSTSLDNTAAPTNDSYATPSPITGPTGTVQADNTHATRELGEPIVGSYDFGGHSLWFTWTAPSTGRYTFDTTHGGTSADTLLSVYTGSTLGTAQLVASNDDIDFEAGQYLSRAAFDAVQGTVYRIGLDTYDYVAAVGSTTLHWALKAGPVSGAVAKAPGTQLKFTFALDTGGSATAVSVPLVLTGLKASSITSDAGTCSGTSCTVNLNAGIPTHVTVVGTPTNDVAVKVQATLMTGANPTATVVASKATICDRVGSSAANTLKGTSGADILCGFGGNDILLGLGGNDLMFGDAGIDTVSYAGAPASTVDLTKQGMGKVGAFPTSGATLGHGRDTFLSIESALGGSSGDVLTGNGGANKLAGAGGNDRLTGNGGADTLVGGAGKDTLNGGAGTDTCKESTDTRLSCER